MLKKFVPVLAIPLFLICSCSNSDVDSKQKAINHLESIRNNIFSPVEQSAMRQNTCIALFQNELQKHDAIDIATKVRMLEGETDESIKTIILGIASVVMKEKANSKAGLEDAAIDYLYSMLEFQLNMLAVIGPCKDGVSQSERVAFSEQLAKTSFREKGELFFETILRFMKEFKLSALDLEENP